MPGCPFRRPRNHLPGSRSRRSSRSSTAAAMPSSGRSATGSTSTRRSSRTATTRWRVRCGCAAPASGTGAEVPLNAVRQRPLGRLVHRRPSRPVGVRGRRRGPIASPRGRRRSAARSERARPSSRASCQRARCCSASIPSPSTKGSPPRRATARASSPRRRSRSTSTASSRASARGTSSSRARGAASAASRRCCRSSPQLGFDVVYLPPVHPIGHTNRKGPNNTLTPGPGDRGLAVGDRRGGGRPRRDPSRTSARGTTSTRWSRRRRPPVSSSRSTSRSSAHPTTRG